MQALRVGGALARGAGSKQLFVVVGTETSAQAVEQKARLCFSPSTVQTAVLREKNKMEKSFPSITARDRRQNSGAGGGCVRRTSPTFACLQMRGSVAPPPGPLLAGRG